MTETKVLLRTAGKQTKLITKACNRFRVNIKQDARHYMPWAPNINDLYHKNKSESVMIGFLRNLTKTKLGSKYDAEIYFF